jgi:hypothetical protein
LKTAAEPSRPAAAVAVAAAAAVAVAAVVVVVVAPARADRAELAMRPVASRKNRRLRSR